VTTAAPPQPTFPHTAYGVSVTWLGEDGGMAAQGHIPDLRFLAACNHMARKDIGLRNIWDDPCLTVDDALGAVIRVWAVAIDPPHDGEEWWVSWGGITEQTPGAFPLTVLWP
jgi:hypothetical protein